ncbi:hypothetical protein [Nocardia arthritidis]|uniref:Uncharacterized protein n=1 Tax=Nocardia arthritidis TaxID=228602 RepID=A0A6G9YAW4_9NOCA|nr:hypothetical protein [Nocardia arthritidis]QIS10352.1 hypothetical protein F5544_12305 [Nocardia arthritidis]
MSDDTTQTPRPLANILKEAQDGHIAIKLSAEDFVNIDRDCEAFKDAIRNVQLKAQDIASHDVWGLGEQSGWGNGEGTRQLVSSDTLVNRFRDKALNDPNSLYQIMDQHLKIVEDIQTAHRTVRDRMVESDANFAAAFKTANEAADTRPKVDTPALASRPHK